MTTDVNTNGVPKKLSFLERIIHESIKHRWIVMIIVISLILFGIYKFSKFPIDAVSDITNV